MVTAEPGVRLLAALYYKSLEIDREMALKTNSVIFDAYMQFISKESKQCLLWWL